MRHSVGLVAILSFLWILNACATTGTWINYTTTLDTLIDNDFAGLELPTPDAIRRSGVAHQYQHTNFDAAWNACLLLLMQRGVIARASKNSAVILSLSAPPTVRGPKEANHIKHWINVGFPMVVFVEAIPQDAVVVHVNWMDKSFLRNDKPNVQAIGIKTSSKIRLSKKFFDILAVELYAPRKWGYLFN